MDEPSTAESEAPRTGRRRGRYKIFLGMAAGVGKTYRMLQEGQAEAEAGRDVVIGYLEPHDRSETIAQANGLELIPRRRVRYRNTELEEMDLPAVVRRGPELCLIDELAHTNAPGLEHGKRYQDIEDVLAAGIDVFSTVNVQHLESLNDQVAEVTGTRVRETVPDAVIGTADEVVLLDLTPESLIERLLAGKIYPQDRVEAALNNFFTIENLAALREVSLRQVAEEVEHKRVVSEATVGSREGRLIEAVAAQAVHERLLALVTPTPKSQRVVRRAWRSAQRLGGELDLLWVSDHEPDEEEREQLEALRRLASVLGAHVLIERGEDIAATAARVAEDRGSTYILMGRPKPRSALRRLLQPALPFRLLSLLPGVDLRIVADRTQLGTGGSEAKDEP
ncbi:MAG TPA: universal stress protein [Solirubrobacteraceae bacterium]|jgi:two-component system sensor histidine kinase KdpD|nr:universal stress protein [Solirubrobacteraceae bacterium]